MRQYGDPVINMLDPTGLVKERLFRSSCVNQRGNFVKDLAVLNRDLSQVIIVDNSPIAYTFNPRKLRPDRLPRRSSTHSAPFFFLSLGRKRDPNLELDGHRPGRRGAAESAAVFGCIAMDAGRALDLEFENLAVNIDSFFLRLHGSAHRLGPLRRGDAVCVDRRAARVLLLPLQHDQEKQASRLLAHTGWSQGPLSTLC